MSFTDADKDTNEMYKYISEVSDSIIKRYSQDLDNIVKKLSKEVDTCSNEELRQYMARVSIEAYNLSISKEQSSLKEACATALYKEGLAKSFNSNTGTVEARKNQSVIDTMDKQAVSILYNSVSNLFKAKVDEAHRIASMLNGILISRSADAKIQFSPRNVGDEPFDIRSDGVENELDITNVNNEIVNETDEGPF